MRFKNRYLVLELSFLDNKDRQTALSGLTDKHLRQVIKEAIINLHGDYGLACVAHSLNVKYLNVITDVGILRVPRDHYRNVWAAISTITSIQATPTSINVIHIGEFTFAGIDPHHVAILVLYNTSGTIKSCQKYIVRRNFIKLKAMLESAKTGVDRKKMVSKIKEVINKDSASLKI